MLAKIPWQNSTSRKKQGEEKRLNIVRWVNFALFPPFRLRSFSGAKNDVYESVDIIPDFTSLGICHRDRLTYTFNICIINYNHFSSER